MKARAFGAELLKGNKLVDAGPGKRGILKQPGGRSKCEGLGEILLLVKVLSIFI